VDRKVLFDVPLFALGIMLSLLGLLYVYSATWVAQSPPVPHYSTGFIKQAAFFVIALAVFLICCRINWGLKPDTWVWFYAPVMVLLLLVLLFGTDHGTGANRWLGFGVVDIQPSEFAKLAFVLILAWLLSWERFRLQRHFRVALMVMASMMILIMLQPDLGTGLVFVFIFFVMCAFARIPRRLILLTFVGLVLLSIPAWFAMKDYQKNRLLAFVGYELVKVEDETAPGGHSGLELRPASLQGAAYQLHQSKIAIGSGGLTGKGFLKGSQVRGGFIPVVESDFIFTLIGEEFGFAGCMLVLLLYFMLLARMLSISSNAKSSYEMFIGYGCTALIFFHVFVGIGMTLGLTPITGLPLPFISQGGSSLMTMWLLLAVNQAIYSNSHQEQQRSSLRL
jgi:rod shape determining protein RodA